MNRRPIITLLAFLALLLPGHGAQVLLKEISPHHRFSEASGPLFASNPHVWSPGFRTAASRDALYLAGIENTLGVWDGFITKMDDVGGIHWTRSMTTLVGGGLWTINDIAIIGSHLYVCGINNASIAYVAKLTLDGVIVDYSRIVGHGGFSNATSISVADVNGSAVITVVGYANSPSRKELSIFQQERQNWAESFTYLPLNATDAFVVNFDANLSAVWATTFGNDNDGNTYGTAVASDNTGALFVAMVCDEQSTIHEEASRDVFRGWRDSSTNKRYAFYRTNTGTQIKRSLGVDHGNPDAYSWDFDIHTGTIGIIYRITPKFEGTEDGGSWTGQEITHHFFPCRLEGGENNSHNRIADLIYHNGSLYAAGEWEKWLRPASTTRFTNKRFTSKSGTSGTTNDIWLAKLSPATLAPSTWRVYASEGEDYAADLTIGPDNSVYLAGIAGGSLKTYAISETTTTTAGSESDPSIGSLGSNSSKAHTFWQKLSATDLAPVTNWHVTPLERAAAVPPSFLRVAGIGVLRDSVIITGAWANGNLTMGPDADREKTLVGTTHDKGFVGFLQQSGDFLEEVEVKINSAYGVPEPHLGIDTVAAGGTIVASVPEEIFEDAQGNIINPDNTAAIREQAVTRRICTGYQFKNSTVNGTVNTVTFVATSDVELTFLWRTEHAIEIDSDIDSVEGLTSTAAGNPDPAVRKHWYPENEPFTAFIDGAQSDIAIPGERWRSTGFFAEGCVADAHQVASPGFHQWRSYQKRQQTNKIVVGSPGKITWKWVKEHSFRVAVNASVANKAPYVSYARLADRAIGFPSGGITLSFHHSHMANDGDSATKYLNFVKEGSGLILEYEDAFAASTIRFTTGDDYPARDPKTVKIEGSQDGENWTSIVASLSIPDAGRTVSQDLPFSNSVAYTHYRITVLSVRDPATADSMQVGEIALIGPRYGVGEYWAPVHAALQLSAASSVSSGTSTLDLKGYTNGQGAVHPFSGPGVTSKDIILTEPSSITWDYARAIYPETVTIGSSISFTTITGDDATRVNKVQAPSGGGVITGPSGSSWENMQTWDTVDKKLYPLSPGKFTVEFENTASPDDPAQNVIIEVEAVWPSTANYTHILEAPPVNLDESVNDHRAFVELAYTESEAAVTGGLFTAKEAGQSVLLFSERGAGAATGNTEKESLVVRVVASQSWETAAGANTLPTVIGEAISHEAHQETLVGHNGYVIQNLAPINPFLYDHETLQGPIIPVNGRLTAPNNHTDLHTGDIVAFSSPDDLFLDSSSLVAAVNFYGDEDVHVNGIPFLTDRASGSVTHQGVTITTQAANELDNYVSIPPSFTGGTGDSAAKLGEIMRDIRWANAPGTVDITISGLIANQSYHLQLLTNEGSTFDRRFDIAVNERLVVDNYTSHGDSARHAWASNNSFAYTGVFRAQANGELHLRLGEDLGGRPPVASTDHNPIVQALVIHSSEGTSPDHRFGVAWYERKEGIRWPHTASAHDPVWPNDPDRIVVASRLGSEGLKRSYTDPAGGINVHFPGTASYSSFNPGPHPTWVAPGSTAADYRPYHHVGVVPLGSGQQMWVYTWGWDGHAYLYRGAFDPLHPDKNLVTSTPVDALADTWTALGTSEAQQEFNVVLSPKTPTDTFGWLNVEVNDGANVYVYQVPFDSPALSNPQIYQQPERDQMGFNPNEEHALIAPSFIEAGRPAAFALCDHLNRAERTPDFTSNAFVLVQYEDRSDPNNPIPKMNVYRPQEEDSQTSDLRLPAFNRTYTYLYEGVAGQRLVPPHPLDTVMGGLPVPDETDGVNIDDRIAYYEDKNAMPWIVSGDADSAEDIRAVWYYPLRADFWHPTKALGDPVSLGKLTETRPRNIWYNTIWPEDAAVLKAGETLTFAGGEYATDNNTQTPRPRGLPQAAAWQSGKLVFDDANAPMTAGVMGSQYLARVFPALEAHEVDLALTSVPSELTPASGNVTVDGLLWRFNQLPASLQERVYYNTSNQRLGVRGLLNGRLLGDGDLLVAPGAQTILQPNVLTDDDEMLVKGLTSSSDWIDAVTVLAAQSRNPNQATVTGSLGIGLEPADNGGARPANSFGPGLAVVTNPDLHDPSTSSNLPDGYITIAENDHEALGDAPVAMHVIKVTREKYRGSVAVMKPGNVFDEKVSLRHTADFGGDVRDLTFQWVLREEDGRDLNPPGIDLPEASNREDSAWTLFKEGKGLSEIQLAGSGPTLITDNLVFCRYGYGDDPSDWSAWAGAANSREPTSPTDPPYVAQLVPGWIKRVTEAVNLFDARYDDFRNNDAPATYTSALQQAGQRWEGPVAFNPNKDAIENVGLIELYQTVLDRAEDFTIASAPGTDGVNTALLNAANRIAGLYTLFGNEAYADALDPTIGYRTVGGEFGTLAPTIHAFQNQAANLLEEELTLLRGRQEVGARPAYNRLMWNFTNGPGEAAYVLNYGIHDLTNDGFLDDEDGRRLYPQGHGDAWGHYTMALKGYYDLATTNNFQWSPRSEKVTIDGVVINVDYLDERTFAKTAAARARCGAELVALTYRQAYTEHPSGQWQGYQDTDTDRAWGVFETAQRTGQGALFDWMLGNALLPEEDASHTGIRKVDRSTVVELQAVAQQASAIQSKLDMADRGLNPFGLDPNVVSFDIDPVLTDRTDERASTHFEQVYDRATGAAENALRSFDQANAIAQQLRQTEATTETLRQQTIDQDLAYRNEMIEIFGTPYEGMIGAGKAYPAGYQGPDLYLWLYVDQVAAGGDLLDPLEATVVETTIVPGLRNLSETYQVHGALTETISNYFPRDLELPNEPAGEITLDLPRQATGYGLVAPESWGQRRSPGRIQAAIQELVHAEWRVRMAMDAYESQSDDFFNLLKQFELKSGIASENLHISRTARDTQEKWLDSANAAFALSNIAGHTLEVADLIAGGIVEAFPKVVGLSADATSAARGTVLAIQAGIHGHVRPVISGLEILQYRAEIEAELALAQLDAALLTQESRSELVDILYELNDLINSESDALVAVVDAIESMRAASDRVRTVIEQGQAILEERRVFNTRVASTTTKQRYEDYTFRVFHHEALRKYRSSFDLASRYAYLAGKAYQYELNLPANHAANARPLLAEMLRTRTLGQWENGQPILGNGGLADSLAVLKTNFETLKGQLGFNNPETEVQSFSLRRELARIGMSSRVNADWRNQLEDWRVPDLWSFEYEHNGVNYGYLFRRFCRPFAPESSGPQPALVIPFDSTIAADLNWFGKTLAGGDSAFHASHFSTKIRAAGVRFDGYNNTAMSQTPQVYLVPVGDDKMFLPDSSRLDARSWRVVDQRIPAPIAISASNLSDPDWLPYSNSAHGIFEEIRKFSAFRAYHDAGGWSASEMLQSGRLVGRSVWNTQWVLIIPDASLLSDPGNETAGLDTFIHGAPLPGYDQTATAATRDGIGVRDIRILLQTYSVSGN